MKIIKGGINAPNGFMSAGEHIGIKKRKKDFAILYSVEPCNAAGVFTKNQVKAAPVLWDQKVISNQDKVQAVVVNSGVANACTGAIGITNNETMVSRVANCLGLHKKSVLACSTGVIGVQLPIEKICEGIESVANSLDGNYDSANNAANAILTTDTFTKQISVSFKCNNHEIKIGGMAKGSGMIHPNMATMLSFITTDANISRELLQKTLGNSIKESYNMISIDGDTSTNDTVLVLANGLAKNNEIKENTEEYEKFKMAFDYVNKYLAREIVKDGEGATKFIEVEVINALKKLDAAKIAKSVINSNLVKTAMFGEDANWGRILCAVGYSGVTFNPNDVIVKFKSKVGEIKVIEKGIPIVFDEKYALAILKHNEIKIIVDINAGQESATAWGCDLSYDYVKINGEYRT